MTLHALAGLPRSGSTLLANVLAQHPDVAVSGTSPLEPCIEAVVNVLSNNAEVTAEIANVPGSYDRYLSAMRGFISGWYSHRTETHIIDKGRGWATRAALLKQLDPDSVLIVCVRDPRDVIASIERQNRATAAFNSPVARTLYESADLLMKPDGMVGGPMRFIEDLIRAQADVVYVTYESLVASTGPVVNRVATAMGLEAWDFDFENVVNVSTDLDALYRQKYPHEGCGPIKPTGHKWSEVFDEGLAKLIASVFPLYMQTFGYAGS